MNKLAIIAIALLGVKQATYDKINSPRPQWFEQGLYIGSNAKNPVSDTLNKATYVLGSTQVIDVGNLAAAGCDITNTFTLTGAAQGDICIVTPSTSDTNNDNITFTCMVSAANTVRLRACASAADNAASDTYRFTIIGQGR